MKKLISLLLACLILASLSVAGFADDSGKNYEQNQADLKAMADCIEAGTTEIELTDEYFTIPTSIYSPRTNVKLSFQSSGNTVAAAIFRIAPDNAFATVVQTQYKGPINITSTAQDVDFTSDATWIWHGALRRQFPNISGSGHNHYS